MQSDIMQPQKGPQSVSNSTPVAQAPTQQPSQPVNMDIKVESPKKPAEVPNTSNQPTNAPKKKEKSGSNMGIIVVACLICATFVGLAIYLKMQSAPVEN